MKNPDLEVKHLAWHHWLHLCAVPGTRQNEIQLLY